MPLDFPVLYKSQDAKTDAIVQSAVAAAIADASQLWKPDIFDGVFAVKGFGITKLKAGDAIKGPGTAQGAPFSYGWTQSVNVASAWETYFDTIISDSCYLVITGFFNFDIAPDTEAIKIIAEGVEYPVYDVQEIYGWDIAVAYFSHPIVVRPEKSIRILSKSRTVGRKKIGFIGYTLGKRSYLIGAL